ncbi:uncharacterized protein LOC106456869 [Limulus polyphemus]|uniref:Uncharacterized protein LOC106456869 n=1 Tax=Limulus polyphemus TaxID=6850 RepID=A0ABM1S414_LIMPO|nr:uncharacterized protein LOC106456869 [Limulus polyphemus]
MIHQILSLALVSVALTSAEAKPSQVPVKTATPKKATSVVYDTVFYLEKGGHRMVEAVLAKSNEGKSDIDDCYIYGDVNIIKKVLDDVPVSLINLVETRDMTQMIDTCNVLLLTKLESGTFHLYPKGVANAATNHGFLIYPGTKWCGAGNVAERYEDLGPAQETDICCRAHDHCNDTIPSLQTKYGLKNVALYTKSLCDCDDVFSWCLKKANTKTSNGIGRVFFNVLQVQCFKLEHPVVKCLRYKGLPLIYSSCQEYQLDKDKSHEWQWFDAQYYDSS